MDMRFIHYGRCSFDKEKFVPIQNREYMNKPRGGFWASPVDSANSWKVWNEEIHVVECDEQNSFTFTLKPEAKVYHIRSVEDANNLPQTADRLGIAKRLSESPFGPIMGVDFEAMVRDGIDAVFCELSVCPQLYLKLNGWDCDSILIMNPEVIIPELN